MKRGEYKKHIDIDYRYEPSIESEKVLEGVFDSIFSKLIQGQKELRRYFKSDDFKKIKRQLIKRKSILVDYLFIH